MATVAISSGLNGSAHPTPTPSGTGLDVACTGYAAGGTATAGGLSCFHGDVKLKVFTGSAWKVITNDEATEHIKIGSFMCLWL